MAVLSLVLLRIKLSTPLDCAFGLREEEECACAFFLSRSLSHLRCVFFGVMIVVGDQCFIPSPCNGVFLASVFFSLSLDVTFHLELRTFR